MSKIDDDKLMDHDYDGIQELDNPLPGWWLTTFYGTIIFAVGYYAYYTFLGGPTHEESLAESMAVINAQKKIAVQSAPSDDQIDLKLILADPSQMKIGKKHFDTICSACHSSKGEGLIGPNLTDKYWLNSKGKLKGLLRAIRKGFPEKGMPPWEGVVPPKDQPALAAYVISLQGTNPPNAKEAQGELVE